MKLPAITLVITVIVWSWTAWQTAGVATAKLGGRTMQWKNLTSPHPFLGWSPRKANYIFTGHALLLGPGQKTTFLIRPVERFAKGRLLITSDREFLLTPPGQPEFPMRAALDNNDYPNVYEFTWSGLDRLPSGYPFTIRNASQDDLAIKKVVLTLLP